MQQVEGTFGGISDLGENAFETFNEAKEKALKEILDYENENKDEYEATRDKKFIEYLEREIKKLEDLKDGANKAQNRSKKLFGGSNNQ